MREDIESDQGFGLVEIIISMLMIALLALIMAPILISGVKSSTKMSTTATATQLVNEGLDKGRALAVGTCATFAAPTPITVTSTDSRGIGLTMTATVSACTANLVTIKASVTADSTTSSFSAGQVLSTATTKVFVK